MPVQKPNSINAMSQMHGVRRARDGANNRSMAQNAALGLGNFSEMLKEGALATRTAKASEPDTIKAAGMNPATARPYIPGFTDTPAEMAAIQKIGAALPGNTPAFAMPSLGMPGAQSGAGNLHSLSTFQRAMQMDSQPLRMLNSLEVSRTDGADAAVLALRSAGHKLQEAITVVADSMGKLSGLFESGEDGVAAIGYDKVGGTSYGKYQIASNTGTMDEFLTFLDKKAPKLADELRAAGSANTGGKSGKMPDVWRGIAAKDPKGFGELQHEFIYQKLYTPTAKKLQATGLDDDALSPVMREVIFSTAVQHGPTGAARIISRALDKVDASRLSVHDGKQSSEGKKAEEHVIRRIYSIRQEQFGSSAARVRGAVSSRLQSEMNVALDMSRGIATV